MTFDPDAILRRDAQGAYIPVIGFGTFRLNGAECRAAVEMALGCGYRHIDTADMYANEREVGQALRTSGVPRNQVFVTTKVWRDNLSDAALRRSAATSLDRLGLDRVDLLLVHWPNADVPLHETIGSLCAVREQGLASHIGVANFPAALLEQAVSIAQGHGDEISANQCEYHPYLDQSAVLAACRKLGVAFVSYAPIGRGGVLTDAVVLRIAAAHERTPAQIVLRWHVQQPDVVAIPKSSNPARIAENLAIFDFELDRDEMRALSGLARPDGRMVNPPTAPHWDR